MSESLVTVVETPEFIRRIDKLMDDDERAALILYLAENPTAGDLIPGTGGVRKLRWGLEGRGLQLKIGAGRQIKDRDRYLAFGVLKSRNSRAGP